MADDHADPVTVATAPARWLLDAGIDGVPLTERFGLAGVVVRDAAKRWPGWWDAAPSLGCSRTATSRCRARCTCSGTTIRP